MKHVNLPDGRVFQFPPETDDSVIDQVVQREMGIEPEGPPVEEIVLQHIGPVAEYLMRGIQQIVDQSARTEQALLQVVQVIGQQNGRAETALSQMAEAISRQSEQTERGLLRVASSASYRPPEARDTAMEEKVVDLLEGINTALRADKSLIIDENGKPTGVRLDA